MNDFIEINASKHGLITINKKYVIKIEEGRTNGGTLIYIDVTANPILGATYYHVTQNYSVVKSWFL